MREMVRLNATEKGRRSDALMMGEYTRRVLCDMIANREADMEELGGLVREMHGLLLSGVTDMVRVEELEARMAKLGVDAHG